MASGAKINHTGKAAPERDTDGVASSHAAPTFARAKWTEAPTPWSRPEPSLRGILEWIAEEALSAGLFWPEICRELEKLFICKALDRSGGCLQEAADLLGVHRNTLGKKLRQYGLDRRSFKKCAD
ncbi:MAG: hypothetical protein Kow00109_24140 [Acidobacteriota bacterium]